MCGKNLRPYQAHMRNVLSSKVGSKCGSNKLICVLKKLKPYQAHMGNGLYSKAMGNAGPNKLICAVKKTSDRTKLTCAMCYPVR